MLRNRFIILLIFIFVLMLPAKADFDFSDGADFTGEAFFESSPSTQFSSNESKGISSGHKTMPPLKKLRLNIQNKLDERASSKAEFAPSAPKEESHFVEDSTHSEYVSEEKPDDFDEMLPDGFEADGESTAETQKRKFKSDKKAKQQKKEEPKSLENIILDCDNVDYDTPNYLINARGNVNINFVQQETVVKCDTLVFDRINNTIKAEGNVRIYKNGRTITGDYIFIDLNEENALIENPITRNDTIELRSRKGYVYGDKITQEDGSLTIQDSYPINFNSALRGPQLGLMMRPKKDEFEEDLQKGIIKLKARDIKIKQKGDLEVISVRKGKIYKGDRTVFVIPAIKVYTNKNHDYAETNFWEVGYYRGLGTYTGPGWVFELPKGSVLKAMPIFNYYKGAGVGALGRFHSGTNQTTAAYGTAASKILIYGRQELDDNLYLQYAMNSYMDEWFMGRRRPKYGIGLVYANKYTSSDFLIPNQPSTFAHRLEAGYYHDLDFDKNFEKVISGGTMGTTRFRYMAQIHQSLYAYRNEDKLTSFNIGILSNLSAALYGTGDTQVIAMTGPNASMQYKRWMQQIGYNFVASDDESPMKRFDAYRYGGQYMYLREYLKLCKWLTVSWFGNINTTHDSITRKRLVENAFYISIGPDDFKFHLGYDFSRQILRTVFEIMMDAKGTQVDYKTFEITQDKKAKKDVLPPERTNPNLAPTQPAVLRRAVVENVKVVDDVL